MTDADIREMIQEHRRGLRERFVEWLNRQQREIDLLKNREAEANRESMGAELFAENRERERDQMVADFQEAHKVPLRDAMIEVSRSRPDLFFKNVGQKKARAADVDLFSENKDRERDRLVGNFQEEHGASLRDAVIEVSRSRPDLFFGNVTKHQNRRAA